MTTIDTPDYQQGVVSAQVLLATVAAGVEARAVDVPPNTETLVVALKATIETPGISVTAGSVDIHYPAVRVSTTVGGEIWWVFYVDISSAIDDEAIIELDMEHTPEWFVYADSGVHVTHDPTLQSIVGPPGEEGPPSALQVAGLNGTELKPIKVDSQGDQYVVAVAPDVSSAGALPVELQYAGAPFAASGALLAAPGVGKRYRIFGAQLMGYSGTAHAGLRVAPTGAYLLGAGPGFTGQLQYLPSGLVLPTNTALNVEFFEGTGDVLAVVQYTTESV